MLDHIGFYVRDFEASRDFYLKALGPLGIVTAMQGDKWMMLGRNGRPQFWFGQLGDAPGSIHLAFSAANRAEVRAFYEAALAAGGKDNGPPGIRPNYHPNYYGAFVFDPDGHNIEAVCHNPE
jgi:catechol 2,3-dioxygenase-like lactoylglutathione lyase family enzyme